MSAVQFATDFRAKIAKLPILYASNYNGNVSKWVPPVNAVDAISVSNKPAVSMIQVTLRHLDVPTGEIREIQTRLSRTEKSITRVLQEASELVHCEASDVVLILDGRVLSYSSIAEVERSVALLITNSSSKNFPLFVFSRRNISSAASAKTGSQSKVVMTLADREDFLRDLTALLAAHSHPDPTETALKLAKHHDSTIAKT